LIALAGVMSSEATVQTDPATALEIYRRARGVSRSTLATLTGLSIESIARHERRERLPRLEHASALAFALTVDIESLFPEAPHA
jgi:transcriptional regulator with XRE-family HTH domain